MKYLSKILLSCFVAFSNIFLYLLTEYLYTNVFNFQISKSYFFGSKVIFYGFLISVLFFISSMIREYRLKFIFLLIFGIFTIILIFNFGSFNHYPLRALLIFIYYFITTVLICRNKII